MLYDDLSFDIAIVFCGFLFWRHTMCAITLDVASMTQQAAAAVEADSMYGARAGSEQRTEGCVQNVYPRR